MLTGPANEKISRVKKFIFTGGNGGKAFIFPAGDPAEHDFDRQPQRASFSAALSAPLQCGPAQ
jgi:hypothetical protein